MEFSFEDRLIMIGEKMARITNARGYKCHIHKYPGSISVEWETGCKKNQPDGKYLLHSVLVDGVSATSSPSLTTWFLTIETVNDWLTGVGASFRI